MTRRVCLIGADLLRKENSRLQPWRYLSEVAAGLLQNGHSVQIITNYRKESGDAAGYIHAQSPEEGFTHFPEDRILRIPSVRNFFWKANPDLRDTIRAADPEIILWHVGLTSFLHQSFRVSEGIKTVGIFTSPIYRFEELLRLGPIRLLSNFSISAVHIMGSLIPRVFLRWRMKRSHFSALVTETKTTAESLTSNRLWDGKIFTLSPGVDDAWLRDSMEERIRFRKMMGYLSDEKVILYMGPSSPLRGLPLLRKAFLRCLRKNDNLRLLILLRGSRFSSGDRSAEDAQAEGKIKIIRGFLSLSQIIGYVAAGDIIAFPFLLVPSDAPLGVLEALAQSKTLVATRVACLPEMLEGGTRFLAQPGDEYSLEKAIILAADSENRGAARAALRSWPAVGEDWSRWIETL